MFLFQHRVLLFINLVSTLFFTNIGFCKPKFIQGLDLNFNLYFSINLWDASVSNNKSFYLYFLLIFGFNYQHLVHWFSTNLLSGQKKSQESNSFNQIYTCLFHEFYIYSLWSSQTFWKLLQIETDDQKWW